MIKLPSLFSVWQQFKIVIFRFPLQVVIALIAVSLWIWVTDNSTIQNPDQVYKLLALCNLAFTSSLAANLYARYKGWKLISNLAIQLLALAFCSILYFLLSPQFFQADLLRFALFILAGHLLVSFSMYPESTNVLEFWHFNKILFLRFITAVLFSITLFAGLSVALLTIDTLFSYDISGVIYFRLFVIISLGFNSLFFLAGIPEASDYSFDLQHPPSDAKMKIDHHYPKILKIFTQYVLIPLLTIYFGILVVYELKIAINAQLPDGMVSVLILGYAVFGILSYLLIYPISKDSGNEWMRQFAELFFWLMLPLLILLFIAIGVRVFDYGLTELRYFIILLAIWLLGISLYFIIRKTPKIQLIPISLFILTLFATYGPQSATDLSKRSQQNRLRTFLPKNDQESGSEKISIINYLVDYHGLPALQEFSDQNLKDIQHKILLNDSLKKNSYLIKSKLRDTAFSLLAIDRLKFDNYNRLVHFSNKEKGIINTGFDYAFWMDYGGYSTDFKSPLGEIKMLNKEKTSIVIKIGEQDSVIFDVQAFQKDLSRKYLNNSEGDKNKDSLVYNDNNTTVPSEWLLLKNSSNHFNVEIHIQSISLNVKGTKKEDFYAPPFSGFVIIYKKKE